ncbi:ATP-binding protein [Desulforamulus ruminis]|uniref:AAA ATPase n=1 Tax=Desulforamulus ruminis (strain ATCC 23193 / DSM 2154 / NCIMB 8452 / DL) TaxID=696281 RepID=F6DU29_DESRL|nr:ATP-binding protein [Desulforamulus ruminis]AEG60104.1 AAA ATPase [Desulforamulus ruminis DSM 2154]
MEFFDPLGILKQMTGTGTKANAESDKKTVECAKCQDRGIYMEGDFAVPCSCMAQKSLANKFKNCQIPKAMLGHSFDRFNFKYYSNSLKEPNSQRTYLEIAQKTFHYAREFARSFIRGEETEGLLIQGPVGSGKTFLACCIANFILQNCEKPILFIIVPDLLEKIKASYANPAYLAEHILVEAASEVPLLIMDDLGAHNYTEWTQNKIYNIINYRVNNQLPTVITTNLDLSGDLTKLLGERTVSRIEQMCYPLWLEREYNIREVIRQEKIAKHITGLL